VPLANLLDGVRTLQPLAMHAPQAQKHPLLGSLMLCMASLLRDFKSEVEDILASDRQVGQRMLSFHVQTRRARFLCS
jgi:hypothetical protein